MTIFEFMQNDMVYSALNNANQFAPCPLYNDALQARKLELMDEYYKMPIEMENK